jgi:hypothetical protein
MTYRNQLNRLLNEYDHCKKVVIEEKQALATAVTKVENVATAQGFVQEIAETIQNKAHSQIASVVCRCLEAVFDNPYEFKIIFERKRGKTEARLVFVRDNNEVDPTTAAGGGATEVAAFALRLACLILSKPRQRRAMVLDEPWRFLKPPEIYGPRICQLLTELANDFGIQFIMVQNLRGFQTGKLIEIE